MKNLGKYHDNHLKRDVLLLADVFEKFTKQSLELYRLDPCHYFSSPRLCWDAMLKMTVVKLELISEVGKYYFFQEAIREQEFQAFVKDIVKQITNIRKIMILNEKVNT